MSFAYEISICGGFRAIAHPAGWVCRGLTLPLAQLVTERYQSLESLYPNAAQCAAWLALERLNPDQRLGQGPDQLF